MSHTTDYLKTLNASHPKLKKISEALIRSGGRVFVVGGAVRDQLLGIPFKDLDLEVHGLTIDQVAQVLSSFGTVDEVGKSFGVVRLRGFDADWSVPRRDSAGRKPSVIVDPSMNLTDAFRRRDLTINALGLDVATGELVDPFGGKADIDKQQLRAIDPKLFIEDPLRLFRVMSFIGRFGFTPTDELNELCRTMDISKISSERIFEEIKKLFLRSPRPSLGIEWLRSIGRLKELFPELAATIGIEQDSKWHPEGDVYVHTLQALDVAATQTYTNNTEKLITLLAVLCHDLGKVSTTTHEADGRIRSKGHAQAGVPLSRAMLKRITNNREILDTVGKLVNTHMDPIAFVKNNAGPAAYKRLASRLAPHTSIRQLMQVVRADKLGRNPDGIGASTPDPRSVDQIDEFVKAAQKHGVWDAPVVPLLKGEDFIEFVEPGPKLGELVKQAYALQVEKGITDKSVLKKLIIDDRKLAHIRAK